MIKKIFNRIVVLIVLSIGASLPVVTLALGQISRPIVIDDALRGQAYQEEIIVFNTEKDNIIVELAASGDLQGWVSFYRLDDMETPVTEAAITGGSNIRLNAIIDISTSAPNGEYRGLISASIKPETSTTSTSSMVYMSQKIDRPVFITVSDNEIIKMGVSVIPNEYDLVEGEALSFRTIYDNQGNIDIRPQIQIKVKKDKELISNVIYPYPEEVDPVRPNQRYEIAPIIIQTAGYTVGEYEAEVDFLINNESKTYKHFTFSYGTYNADERYSVAGYVDGNIFFNYFKDNIIIINILIAIALLMVTLTVVISKKQLRTKKNK